MMMIMKIVRTITSRYNKGLILVQLGFKYCVDYTDGDGGGHLGDQRGHVCPSTVCWAGPKISNELKVKGRGHLMSSGGV